MLNHFHAQPIDPVAQRLLVIGLLGVGAVLLLLLALQAFPGLRRFLAWASARIVCPDRWNDDTRWDDFRRGLVAWLDPPDEKSQPHGQRLALSTHEPESLPDPKPRVTRQATCAYVTYRSDDHRFLVKQSLNNDGDRLLGKELKVIKRLRSTAAATHYLDYLPEPVEQQRSDVGRTVVYRGPGPAVFTAAQIHQRHPHGLSGEHVAWMFNRMLEAIGFAHQHGSVHAAVMPQHLLFDCRTHGLQLTDWTHAKRIGSRVTFIPARYQMWYPDVAVARAEPSLDIYMAAKSACYLAGASVSDRSCRGALPKPIHRFLQSCLIESPRMRPGDAWQLHEEFRETLEAVYGEPKFCSLPMS